MPERDNVFDLLVIGAGINGVAIARDAAMRGLTVVVVERDDIASGTTAWSSRLIHGGLRYLEHGELGLVRESLRERERLLQIARHLVRPAPFLLPIYAGRGRGPRTIRAGMLAYDLLSIGKRAPRHAMLSAAETRRIEPGLAAKGLRGSALYWDAQAIWPERLAVETALSARECGAVIRTHTTVERLAVNAGRVEGAFARPAGGDLDLLRARVVVNAAGPSVDSLLAAAGTERLIGGTKGSHVVVAKFDGAPRRFVYAEAVSDGRPFFVMPWQGGLYLIGTTDTRFEGNPRDARPTAQEAAYLLAETNRLFPAARLEPRDVLLAYAGVRPLPSQPAGAEGRITRRHSIHSHAPVAANLLSLVGGKLTTHRKLAEETVNHVERLLGRRPTRCPTADTRLPGAPRAGQRTLAIALDREFELPSAVIERLVGIYGARARTIAALAHDDAWLREPLRPGSAALRAEALHAFTEEEARTVTDVLMRRMMLGLGPGAGRDDARPVAEVGRRCLGWSAERVDAEVAAQECYIERLRPVAAPLSR